MPASFPVTGQVALAGSDVSRRPAPSTPAQKDVVGHERSVIAPGVCTRTGGDQVRSAADAADALPSAVMTANIAAATAT